MAIARDRGRGIIADVALTRIRGISNGINLARDRAHAQDLALARDLVLVRELAPVVLSSDSRKADLVTEKPLAKPSPAVQPPVHAERLLVWLASSAWDEAVLGDFLEHHERNFSFRLQV